MEINRFDIRRAASVVLCVVLASLGSMKLAAALPRDEAGPAAEMPSAFRAEAAAVFAAARSVTAEKYPDADCVTIDERVHHRYEADGSAVCWDDEWVKCLTEKGRREMASFATWLSLRYGDVTVQCVEIVDADGGVRAVDFGKTLKEATDNSSMSSNIYDPLDLNLTFGVPDIKVGEIRHVRICRRLLKPRIVGEWADIELFEDTRPIVRTEVTVDWPAEKPLVHAALRRELPASVTRSADRPLGGGRTLSRWFATYVAQAFPEPSMPTFYTQAQHLRLSTSADWPTISRWYWNVSEPHLAAANEAMTNKVAELAAGLDDRMRKIRAIFRFVSQEIRYMGLTLEDTAPGYAPHDVSLTFDNRYGVCRDKAALLVAMLRLAGIDAYPVLINVGPKLDAEVPSPYFNHAIVAVDDVDRPADASGRHYLLMDPTNEASKDLMPAYLMNRSYLVARPDGEGLKVSPVEDPSVNRARVDTRCTLLADGALLAKSEIRMSGYNDNLYRHEFLGMSPSERRMLFEEIVRGAAPGAEIDRFEVRPADLRDTDKPLEIDVSFRAPEALGAGATRDSLLVPFLSPRLSLARRILKGKTSLEERRFDLVLPLTASGEETVTVTLGDAVGSVKKLPESVKIGRRDGYSFARSFEVADGVLTARREERLAAVEFAPGDYVELREDLKDQETGEKPQPLFLKNPIAGADVRTISQEIETRLTDARSYVETNHFVREILTYEGKKSNSELRFQYNPTWESVEVVSATVESRDGRASAVTPKEINVMDADWAGPAPRYPASKILVVTLPAVEIGSVVDVTIARRVTGSPTAFAQLYGFDGVDPIDSKKVRIVAPEKIFTAGERAGYLSEFGENVYSWTVENPHCVPREPSQPPRVLWRPFAAASAVRWKQYGAELAGALADARASGSVEAKALAARLVEGKAGPAERITALREHLCRKVKVVGPGLLELRFDRAFSSPDRALADGYASAADWVNLMYAMLEAAGFECDYLLSASDAEGHAEVTDLYRDKVPMPSYFDAPLVRARWREGGGWLPFFGKKPVESVWWVSFENEYTPAASWAHGGDSCFDLARGEFGKVDRPAADGDVRVELSNTVWIRENGAADFDVVRREYGPGVGAYRRRYEEMLGEERRRHYRALLGKLSENATATKDLVTDVKGYPAVTTYSAYVPGFAVVNGDEITLRLPGFAEEPFDVGGPTRKSPMAVSARGDTLVRYEVVFPQGYTAVERLPEAFAFVDPLTGGKAAWGRAEVTAKIESDRRLHVVIERRTDRGPAVVLPTGYYPLLKEWNRVSVSEASRTIAVRMEK